MRSCTRRCSVGKRWSRPRTRATTSGCLSTHGRWSTSLYFEDGQQGVATLADFTSENTDRLDVDGTKALLLTLPEFSRPSLAAP